MPRNILFDLIAPLYDRLIAPRAPEDLLDVLKLPTQGKMLDASGGTGRVSAALEASVGIMVLNDLSQPMLVQAHAKGLKATQAQAHHLPFPAESFERVLMVDALHHIGHQKDAVREMLRVLKPGGRLVIEEPDITLFRVKLVALGEKLMLMGSHFLSPKQIKDCIEKQGYTAQIETDGEFAAWIIVDK
jgi:demethylmenaquinone methyltransferase/2-methoxy-6-polyprenyl-1,4-benzoquinol methylase